MTNAERFTTEELKQWEEVILTADDRAKALEYELFLELRKEVSSQAAKLSELGRKVASSDVLSSFNMEIAEKLCVPDIDSLTSWGFPSEEHDSLIENSRRSVQKAIRRFSEEAHVDPRSSLLIVDRLHPYIPLLGPPSPGKLAEALTNSGHPSCIASYPNPAILTSAPWELIHNLAQEVSTAGPNS